MNENLIAANVAAETDGPKKFYIPQQRQIIRVVDLSIGDNCERWAEQLADAISTPALVAARGGYRAVFPTLAMVDVEVSEDVYNQYQNYMKQQQAAGTDPDDREPEHGTEVLSIGEPSGAPGFQTAEQLSHETAAAVAAAESQEEAPAESDESVNQ